MALDILIKNANEIVKENEVLKGDIGIKDGMIVYFGGQFCEALRKAETIIDATNKIVLPGFVDCHSHLVYAGSRHFEYEGKTAGEDYTEQHKKGGILYTVEQTRNAYMEDLIEKGLKDLDIMLKHGTTTVEIKSGYGLDERAELRILYVIHTLQKRHPITIIPTFLGAHTIPNEYKDNRQGYVELVKNMIPKVKELAEYCDVFCDNLGFTYNESKEILTEALNHGLKLKIHAEQTGYNMGAELAAKLKVTSADHLDYVTEKEMDALKEADVTAVLLPGVTYHLTEMIKGHKHTKGFLPEKVRKMIQKGLRVAIATDYNPGSCNTQSMKTIMEAAARLYRMNFREVINAATINAAHAIDRADEIGSIRVGKKADLVVHDCKEHGMLIDNFGINLVDTVIKNGTVVYQR
ncbi:MAG: imidazolonepropionase [Nanoarchaeota archaeon]|nr:imidazolonepropionase [Nanoarchaeota archaeon]